VPKRNRANEQRKQFGSSPIAAPRQVATADATVANAPLAPPAPKPVMDEQTRAAKMFAESLAAHEAADQAARERVRAETEQMQRHDQLKANKQRAADLIKELRGQDRARQRRAEAEAAYRLALAELQEFETGERPHWAPAPLPDEQVGDVSDSDHSDHSDTAEADAGPVSE
jgi:hypothetical protein